MSKAKRGNFLEDFQPGSTLVHATPRTLTEADNTLNIALTGVAVRIVFLGCVCAELRFAARADRSAISLSCGVRQNCPGHLAERRGQSGLC